MLGTMRVQSEQAARLARDAQRVAERLKQERMVDEDVCVLMCERLREKEEEVRGVLFSFF
jgi:hypothetical protein